jgi:hypothetical protein
MKYAQSRWQGRGWKYKYGRADFLKFVGPSGQKITKTRPAMFSNINTQNGGVDASQPV